VLKKLLELTNKTEQQALLLLITPLQHQLAATELLKEQSNVKAHLIHVAIVILACSN
jgi:hypothetical protein